MDFATQQRIKIARYEKVRKLIAALDCYPGANWDTTAMASQRMNDDMWEALAYRAGVNPPSEETRKMVREALIERLAVRNRVAVAESQRGMVYRRR